MTDFVPCAPVYGVSHNRKRPTIEYRSKRWEGTVLEFCYKSTCPSNASIIYYQCISCMQLAKLARAGGEKCSVSNIKIVSGVIITDPDNPNTPHNCAVGKADCSAGEVLAKRYMYEKRTEVRETRKRPRQAFDEAVEGVDKRFKDEYGSEVANEIKMKLSSGYGFNSKRRALTDNRSHFVIKDNSLEDIHPSLRLTKDGELYLQKYDLTTDREMLVFFAKSDLHLLLQAEFILGDGNHKYNPPEFHNPGEMYSLHVIVKGECHPFLFALSKMVDTEAYRQLFETLRDVMMKKFGHLGSLCHCIWLFDYETAAIGACRDVFNPLKVQGCAFHYAKAINAKRDDIGLKTACTEKDENGAFTHQANSIKKFFKRVRHFCFLPEHLRLHFARDFLAGVRVYPSPVINAQLKKFSDYFTNYWLTNSTIRDAWGQFGNFGPRTTNYVEGFHNGLHSRMQGRHPSLAELIGLFQLSQHSSKFRIQALLTDPLALPLPQKPDTVRKNQLLQDEQRLFHQYFTTSPTSYQDILNYIDRVISIGVLSQQL